MIPQIRMLEAKKLVGINLSMSLAQNKMAILWKQFMPRRTELKSVLSNNLFSVVIYDRLYFEQFNPNNHFEKWAAMEVSATQELPLGMETLLLPAGLYAVFAYKGSSADTTIFQYIFGTWLPESNYVLDQRPHFEILGENYQNNSPQSEEEIWIPIRPK